MDEKIDVVELLKTGKTIQISPQGFSMYPLIVPGRDDAILRPLEDKDLRRGQVLLFRGRGNKLTLHRVWKVKSDGVYFVGDKQVEVEGPIERNQIFGTMCGYVRNGKEYAVDGPLYYMTSRLWLLLRPIRNVISIPIAKIRGNR